ncbi:MAG: winged helix-turn-helix domain-containing protein [Acidobacteriaceae bacterium]|nr:winged helix-turn-helix domain-containing protein [Acidobacteriaceae bacterium]
MTQGCRPEIISFDGFTLRPETGELWKEGTKLRLQQKPRLILEALLQKPGELVTREELRKILWADGTFVDYESGLNTAVNRLRMALRDSADKPLYIETLPRLGYRFIWPIAVPPVESTPPASVPAPPRKSNRMKLIVAALLLALLALIWGAWGRVELLSDHLHLKAYHQHAAPATAVPVMTHED